MVLQVLCASYVDEKHRMARPAFAVDTEWKYVPLDMPNCIEPCTHNYHCVSCATYMHVCRYAYEESDVVVLRKEYKKSPFHWLDVIVLI